MGRSLGTAPHAYRHFDSTSFACSGRARQGAYSLRTRRGAHRQRMRPCHPQRMQLRTAVGKPAVSNLPASQPSRTWCVTLRQVGQAGASGRCATYRCSRKGKASEKIAAPIRKIVIDMLHLLSRWNSPNGIHPLHTNVSEQESWQLSSLQGSSAVNQDGERCLLPFNVPIPCGARIRKTFCSI